MSTAIMALSLPLLDWSCRPLPYLRDRANLPHPPSPRLPALVFSSSPSASDSSSSISTTDMCTPSSPESASGSASPIRISVCDVPVLAPRPLPYHSPTFLQFDLPDTDEDLSHPPYTHRPAKRKRNDDDDRGGDDLPPPPPAKRRAHHIHAWRSRVHREQQLSLQHLPSPRHPRQLLYHGAWMDHVPPLRPPPASVHRSSGLPFADQPLGWHNHP